MDVRSKVQNVRREMSVRERRVLRTFARSSLDAGNASTPFESCCTCVHFSEKVTLAQTRQDARRPVRSRPDDASFDLPGVSWR
jgi:hypothetical protein